MSKLNEQNKSKNDESNDLLKRQQQTTEKLTALLEQSTSALSCGPTCQKLKTSEELKKKYVTSQTNMKTAPIQLENSKKNYYVFTEGESYYNDMLEAELQKKAEMITKLLAENFIDEIKNAKTMNSYYSTDLVNSSNTEELYNIYLVKNREIQKSIKGNHSDVLTNDRKTYYETDALEKLLAWYDFFWYMYYAMVIVFTISIVLNQSIGIPKKIIFIFFAIIYPYVINFILGKIYGFLHSTWKQLPKNVYNDL
jgi:hypothetical protein